MCKFVQPITVIYKVYTKIHKSIKKIYIHKKILNYIWPLFPGTGIQKNTKMQQKKKSQQNTICLKHNIFTIPENYTQTLFGMFVTMSFRRYVGFYILRVYWISTFCSSNKFSEINTFTYFLCSFVHVEKFCHLLQKKFSIFLQTSLIECYTLQEKTFITLFVIWLLSIQMELMPIPIQ